MLILVGTLALVAWEMEDAIISAKGLIKEIFILKKNQIILLGTDGIWEARNLKGEMFGKEPIYRTIRQNPALGAKEILAGIFNTLNRFLGARALEDDVTLVVIKVTDD